MSEDHALSGPNGNRLRFDIPVQHLGPTEPVRTTPPSAEPALAPSGRTGFPHPAERTPLVQQRPALPASSGLNGRELVAADVHMGSSAALMAPSPVAPTPPAGPVEPQVPNFEADMRREGYERPRGPDEPGSEVSFSLRRVKGLGFGMTVAAAGAGQVLFFSEFFGGGWVGWGAAGFIAAFAEVTMIGSGDSALRHKVEGAKGWKILLVVSASIAIAAGIMQIGHWWGQSVAMALTFGIASVAGWAVHISSGVIAANNYLRRKAVWDAELARRRARWEQREQAEYDRLRVAEEDARMAARRGMREAAERTASLAPPAVERTTPSRRPSRGASRRLDQATARTWSEANDGAKPAQVMEHFSGLGYEVPARSTIRRWLNKT